MKVKSITFKPFKDTLQGRLALADDPKPTAVLFLGGVTFSALDVFKEWQEFLTQHGFNSFCFDYPGLGNSEGQISQNSLMSLVELADQALDLLVQKSGTKQIYLIGNSMGSHIAIRLAEKDKRVKALVFKGPAAYGAEAESVPIGPNFTKVIRQPESWRDSPVFAILETLKLPSIMFYGEHESTIPSGVKESYKQAIKGFGELITIPNVGHFFSEAPKADHQAANQLLLEKSVSFLK